MTPAETKTDYDFRHFDNKATLIVSFHLTREFKVRAWIAMKLIVLAAKVLKCDIRIEE